MKEIVRAALCLSAAILLSGLSLFGQTTGTGAIVGRAQDSTSAVIPGVEVTISSPQMIGGAKTFVTDEQGVYRFELLPPGTYTVKFALPGFKTINIQDVVVQPNITMTINGPMEVSQSSEEVTVTSQAPAIDLQEATIGVNWSQKMIDELPWSRSLVGISAMIPNALATSYDVGNSSFGTSSTITARNGGYSGSNMVQMDGLYWCQTYEDYGTYEEMNVSSMAKGAEQLNAGITLSLVVKSGSNQFHGNLSSSYQNGSMQSNNITPNILAEGFSAGSTKYTHFTDYYGDLGGPVMKDKFWFYIAYRDGYQGQYIPGFVTAVGGTPQVFYTQLKSPTVKLTYQLTPKQKLDAYWAVPSKEQPYRNASALIPQDASYHQLAFYGQGPNITWTYIADSKTSITARITHAGLWQDYAAHSMPGSALVLGLAAGGTQPLPLSSFYGMDTGQSHITLLDNVGAHVSDTTTGATDGAYTTNYTRQIRWQWNADVSRVQTIFGKANEIKVGYMGWWDLGNHLINYGYPYQEAFQYTSLKTDTCPGSSICSNYFLHPNSVVVTNLPSITATGGKYDGTYINDKITLSRKLTLNVGVRWDHSSAFLPAQGNSGSGPFGSPLLIPYSTSVTNPSGYLSASQVGDVANFPVYNLVTPRISLAYDVFGNGKFAVKGSYGRYSTISSSPGASIGPVTGTALDPISTQSCTFTGWNGVIPYVPNFGAQNYLGSSTNVNLKSACPPAATVNGVPVGQGVHEFDPNLAATYVSEYTAGVEIGLSRNYSIRANVSRKFAVGGDVAQNPLTPYGSYTDTACVADPGNPAQSACAYTIPKANPNRLLSDIYYAPYNLSANEGTSSYTAYDFTINKQFANKWSFLLGSGFYWTHPGVPNPITPNGQISGTTFTPNAIATLPNWTPSFKFNSTYELPGPSLYHGFLQGFMWANTFTSQKGDWLNRSVSVTDLLGASDTVVTQGQFRRQNSVTDWDQRISKRFHIGDRESLEVKWDLYNTLNANPVTAYKSTNISSSTYLAPSTVLASRIYEWGATFKF